MLTAPSRSVRMRRFSGATEWCWYVVAAVSYILAGIWNRWLLNWLLGPIWLVAVICLGPPMATWLRVQVVDRLIASRLIGRR
jgi:hypothetical protein